MVEALGQIGDKDTLALLVPLRDSFPPGVAAAAEVAIEQIEARLGQAETILPSRPRTVGSEKPSP